jgi:hypothetical protein
LKPYNKSMVHELTTPDFEKQNFFIVLRIIWQLPILELPISERYISLILKLYIPEFHDDSEHNKDTFNKISPLLI